MRRKLFEQMGMPVGDPFGGPAYGKREDIGTVLSVGGSLLGGFINSKGTQSAADTQASATDRAAQLQADAMNKSTAELARQYNLTRSDSAPYRAAGTNALAQLQAILGMKPSDTSGPGGVPSGVALRGATGLVRTDSNGNAIANQDLYDSDPVYRQAWDELAAGNQINGKTVAYGNAPGTAQGITQALNNYLPTQADYTAAHPTNNAPTTTPADLLTTSATLPTDMTRKFSVADFWNDPVVQASYQSGLDLGTKALKNSAPLTTGLDSGAALKELTKFGTDYTGNMAAGSQARFVGDQTNQFNRLMTTDTNQFNRLATIAGVGQIANNTIANAGASTAGGIANATMAGGTNLANLYSNLGNATAASKIAGANSWGNGLTSVSNFWNQQQMLDKISGRGSSIPNNFNGGFSGNPTYNYDSYGTTG